MWEAFVNHWPHHCLLQTAHWLESKTRDQVCPVLGPVSSISYIHSSISAGQCLQAEGRRVWAPVTAPSPCASGVQVGSMLEPESPINGETPPLTFTPWRRETRSSSLFGLHEGRRLLWVWSSWGGQMESQHREEKWT